MAVAREEQSAVPETPPTAEIASFEQTDLKLKKTMGLTQLTALSLGAIIGSGWLFAVLGADSTAGPASVLSWLIGGICVLFIAFTYMEISAMLPRTGALSAGRRHGDRVTCGGHEENDGSVPVL